MDRYVCIHGHFYQPPRENPWLEEIEQQDSARPYHDWNERITEECYGANAASRILDRNGKIVDIVNNYSKISFNFGPTLIDWLKEKSPDVYRAILEADRESQKNFSGHGSAIAQAYNHVIMPLANQRDKYTQALWGIRNFESHFGRSPEGMWLPETAVDLETLDILADLGILFTILSPHQASRVRRIGSHSWQDVSGGRIETGAAYEARLPTGRKIAIFFYDDSVSKAVAFEKLLTDGELFAHRLMDGFSPGDRRLVNVATDGETYGHHHRFGDMALAYALDYIESSGVARLTNYGEYLERHPPQHEVEIFENTSWSCAHGIERWRSACGCSTGGSPGWNQSWRGPLRNALDWLRDTLIPAYESEGKRLSIDPCEARNDYVSVVLDRSADNVERFLKKHSTRELSYKERTRAIKLLELERHAMLFYTSCGWFFSELSGIETVQVIQYAARVIQLAEELFDDSPEAQFLDLLEIAKSNVSQHRDGRFIYEKFVSPSALSWEKLAAEYGICSLFEEYEEIKDIYCYEVEREDYRRFGSEKSKLSVGRVKMTSRITLESEVLGFGVLQLGELNLNAAARRFQNEWEYRNALIELGDSFRNSDVEELILLLDKHFGKPRYSLATLFRDEQRRLLNALLESIIRKTDVVDTSVNDRIRDMLLSMKSLGIDSPWDSYSATELVLSRNLRLAFENHDPDIELIQSLLETARLEGMRLDVNGLEHAARRRIEEMSERLLSSPFDFSVLQKLDDLLNLARSLPFVINLRKPQNSYYEIFKGAYREHRNSAEWGDKTAIEWIYRFKSLGEKLSIRVD